MELKLFFKLTPSVFVCDMMLASFSISGHKAIYVIGVLIPFISRA